MTTIVVDVPKTFGALLLGGLFAALLSGVVAVQVIVYFKLYSSDTLRTKLLVLAIWFLDTCHTGFIWAALWEYLIQQYGDISGIDFIPWNIALTIVLTAILTFLVHCFFAHRIFMLSQHNWFITIPIVLLAVLRLVSACATTGTMIHLHSFATFALHFRWLFTLGLALSSCVDILITCSLFFLLQTSRTGGASLNIVIDSLIRYAFETGSLTCAGTIVSMLCWLTMRNNLIFMGLHFVISKLYANSLLVTLNTRQTLRRARSQPSGGHTLPTLPLDPRRYTSSDLTTPNSFTDYDSDLNPRAFRSKKVEINVTTSIEQVEEPIVFKSTR